MGLSEVQGHGIGRRCGQLGICSLLSVPGGLWWRMTVLLRQTPGPSGPSHPRGDGPKLWGFCGVWPVSLLTRQSKSVLFMMRYFCYCANLRHRQLDPLTLDRHPV